MLELGMAAAAEGLAIVVIVIRPYQREAEEDT